jgi:hypothetical protein
MIQAERDPADVARGVQLACALIACHSDRIVRESYVQLAAKRSGYEARVIREEVDRIAGTGNAVAICRNLRDGARPSASMLSDRAAASEQGRPAAVAPGEGWWNRPQGEGEDGSDHFYRLHLRLPILQYLTDWARLGEWCQRVDDRVREKGEALFAAEWAVWREMAAEQAADPIWAELRGEHGAELLEAERAEEVDLALDLMARVDALGLDATLRFTERLAGGMGDIEAARETLAELGA